MNISHSLNQIFSTACQQAFPELDPASLTQMIVPATKPEFGHYQCNVAMPLSKPLQTKPRAIAARILEHLNDHMAMIGHTEIAGPGFINITLSSSYLTEQANHYLAAPQLIVKCEKPQHIIVDYASPNVAKEMHVGHLRSTIIGDTLANIYAYHGHTVERINHIGDWGTAFGMLVAWIEAQKLSLETLQNATVTETVQWYRAAKQDFDTNPEFKQNAKQAVVRLQSHEPAAYAIWQALCALSRNDYQALFALLNVSLIERGESTYHDLIPEVVERLNDAHLTEKSDGALCIFDSAFTGRDDQPLPLIVVKSDGGYNYASTDLAALFSRSQVDHADKILYVTDSGQRLHFDMVFSAGRRAGWLEKCQPEHIGFGLVLGADGKKFRTRSGETVALSHLLNEAVAHAKKALAQNRTDVTDEEAKTFGIGAVKYADLSTARTTDYKFNLDSMLSLEGNTIAFIMYSYVRGLSIQQKSSQSSSAIEAQHETEQRLLMHLLMLPEALDKVLLRHEPHLLCDYLYNAASLFNAFIRDCRIIGDPQESARLSTIALYCQVIQQGLALLGIGTINTM